MIYRRKPKYFKTDFEIVSLLIEHESRILLLHRHSHKTQGGKWGVPAGKVDAQETLEQALLREVKEETGMDIGKQEVDYFDTVYVVHPESRFVYHMYFLKLMNKPKININPKEHQSYTWSTLDEALAMDLIDDEPECLTMFYLAKEEI